MDISVWRDLYRVIFNWSRPKSVGDGRIPTKISESKGMSHRKCEILTQTFPFLVGPLPSSTFWAGPVEKHPVERC